MQKGFFRLLTTCLGTAVLGWTAGAWMSAGGKISGSASRVMPAHRIEGTGSSSKMVSSRGSGDPAGFDAAALLKMRPDKIEASVLRLDPGRNTAEIALLLGRLAQTDPQAALRCLSKLNIPSEALLRNHLTSPRDAVLQSILAGWAIQAPLAAAAWAQENCHPDFSFPGPLISKLAAVQPEAAAQLLLKNSSSRLRLGPDLTPALKPWLERDPQAADRAAKLLEGHPECRTGLSDVFKVLAAKDKTAALHWAENASLATPEAGTLLANSVSHASPELAFSIQMRAASSIVSSEAAEDLFLGWTEKGFEEPPPGVRQSSLQFVAAGILRNFIQWRQSNPEEAGQYVGSMPSGPLRSALERHAQP